MGNLIDTHALIWFLNGDPQLSEKAIKTIEANANSNFVSIASIWEIAIKVSLGKLELNKPFSHLSIQIKNNGFQILGITFEDTVVLSSLPFHHRDPFDRIIISQSISNNLAIVSKDRYLEDYGTGLIW